MGSATAVVAWIGLGGVPPIGGMTRVRGIQDSTHTVSWHRKKRCAIKSYFCLASHSSFGFRAVVRKPLLELSLLESEHIFLFSLVIFLVFVRTCTDHGFLSCWKTAHHCRDERSASRADPAWQPAKFQRENARTKRTVQKKDILYLPLLSHLRERLQKI